MQKKPTNSIESYYRPLASRILAPSTVPTRKVVDGSLKDQNTRVRRSGSLDQASIRN